MIQPPFQRKSALALVGVFALGAAASLYAADAQKPAASSEQPAAQKPPEGAVVLFDGKDLSKWQGGNGGEAKWKIVDGAMEVNGTGDLLTRDKFTDFKLHVEFMPPVMPEAKGQAKGNSGVYLINSYEVQVLDSHGIEKLEMGDCASIYGKKIADKNASLPPGQWQTYDIDFTAPKFDAAGKKTSNARVTVIWNGQKVHDNVEIDGPTGGGQPETAQGGGIRLQDHGNPVRYRNIWIVPAGGKK